MCYCKHIRKQTQTFFINMCIWQIILLENRGITTCRSILSSTLSHFLRNKQNYHNWSFLSYLTIFHYITVTIHLNVNALICFWLIASLFWLKNKIYLSEFFKYLCLKCHFMLLNIMQIILEIFSYSGLCRLVTLQKCSVCLKKVCLKNKEKIFILIEGDKRTICLRKALWERFLNEARFVLM